MIIGQGIPECKVNNNRQRWNFLPGRRRLPWLFNGRPPGIFKSEAVIACGMNQLDFDMTCLYIPRHLYLFHT